MKEFLALSSFRDFRKSSRNVEEFFLGKSLFYIHGEVKFSLVVDGEITETATFPAPEPFEAIAFDETGTISISYFNKIHHQTFLNQTNPLHLPAFQLIVHKTLFPMLHP
jgi:hypothetical protein